MKKRPKVSFLILALILTAVPAFSANVNVGGEVKYQFVAPINTREPDASSSTELNYSINATIDKKWSLKVNYDITETVVDKIEIKYGDKGFNIAAYKKPGGDIGELTATHNLLVFPPPWGDATGYMLRGWAQPFGIEVDYQVIDSGWYASEMNGLYLRGSADIKGNKITVAGRTIQGEEKFDLYQGAVFGAIPVGKLKLEPGVGLTQRHDKKKDNLAFGVKLSGPVADDLEMNLSTRISQANFDSRAFAGDLSEQKASLTWKKKLLVSGELTGPKSDKKARKLVLNSEWRNSPANNDFGKQFADDKYYTNKDFGVGLQYTRDKKGEEDNPLNVILLRATAPVVPNKVWVLGSTSYKYDKDFVEQGLYTATKKLDGSLKARAKVVPKLTLDGYFDYNTAFDSKTVLFSETGEEEEVKVESGALGLSATYDLSKIISVGAKGELSANHFGEGNTVVNTLGANWLLKTSDNAQMELGYLRKKDLLDKAPSVHLVSATIKLKF